jgi:hypothetical protein
MARCTCGPRYGEGNGPIRSVLGMATALPGAALDLDPGAVPTAIIAATIAEWPQFDCADGYEPGPSLCTLRRCRGSPVRL